MSELYRAYRARALRLLLTRNTEHITNAESDSSDSSHTEEYEDAEEDMAWADSTMPAPSNHGYIPGYSGDYNEQDDDDMDFYGVDSHQAAVTAGAVRSLLDDILLHAR